MHYTLPLKCRHNQTGPLVSPSRSYTDKQRKSHVHILQARPMIWNELRGCISTRASFNFTLSDKQTRG